MDAGTLTAIAMLVVALTGLLRELRIWIKENKDEGDPPAAHS